MPLSLSLATSYFSRLSNPGVRQWMIERKMSTTTQVHKYYADRILNITRNISVTPIVWQDVWDEHVQVNCEFNKEIREFL